MPTTTPLIIRRATAADATELESLINKAFQNDNTTDIYLSPNHELINLVSEDSIKTSLTRPDQVVFVGVDPTTSKIGGHFSVRRQKRGSEPEPLPSGETETETAPVSTWFALLAVDVTAQGHGWGSQLLSHAEKFSREEWGAKSMEFDVVNTRSALRAWYGKRGYLPTGETKPFAYELHPGWEGTLRDDLEFVMLRKEL